MAASPINNGIKPCCSWEVLSIQHSLSVRYSHSNLHSAPHQARCSFRYEHVSVNVPSSNRPQASGLEYMDRTRSAPAIGQAIPPSPLSTAMLQRSSTTPDWQSMPHDLINSSAFFSDNSMPNMSTFQPVNEEYNPADYVNSCIEPSSSSHSIPIPLPQSIQPLRVQLTPDMQWSTSFDGSTSPSTPSTVLMTPVTQFSNPMSRHNSHNPQFLNTSMFAYSSDSSCMFPMLHENGDFSFSMDFESKAINNTVDGVSFNGFTGLSSETLFSPSVSASAHALAFSPNEQPGLAKDMRRSASSSSSESTASEASASMSISSRQSRREREINAQAASRKIAPKAMFGNCETESASSNVRMAKIKSEDGSSKTVGVLTKAPYVRPQHPKIMCKFCNEKPDGFRGTHELERHIARAHAVKRKGYICIDSSPDQKFLANCKHCRNKKTYGAYYNAAAHLRRTHFHPRKRGKKGKNDEKRGGIGGGDDPPMDILKQHWIREVEVTNTPGLQSPDSDSEDMAEPMENAYSATYNLDTSYSTSPPHAKRHRADSQQIAIDPSQYIDCMYDTTLVGYDLNMAAPEDIQTFEFDAYMPC